MGGKYEITGWNYPFKGHYDFHEFADSCWKAKKIYRQAKKKYYCVSFTIRIQKNKFKGVGV